MQNESKGERREKRTQFNRKNIVEAAQKLFEEKGFQNTTMDEIAKFAEYSKSTIYVYFQSKEEIYHQILLNSMQMLRDRLSDCVLRVVEMKSCFFEICHTMAEFQEEYPMYFEAILENISVEEEDLASSRLLQEIYETGEEINRKILQVIHDGIETETLRPHENPLVMVFVLWAEIGGVILMAAKKQAYFKKELLIKKEEFLDAGFAMIWNAIAVSYER